MTGVEPVADDIWSAIDAIEQAKVSLRTDDHRALIERLRAGIASPQDQEQTANLLLAAIDVLDDEQAEEAVVNDEPEDESEPEGDDPRWWMR